MTRRTVRRRKITARRPAEVILGRRKHLGKRLNTIGASRAAACPACRGGGPLEVFERAVRWSDCGHTRDLPPMPSNHHRKDRA